MNVSAVDPALHLRPEAFKLVDGRARAGVDVLFGRVVHRVMRVRHASDVPDFQVRAIVVGVDFRARLNRRADHRKQRPARAVGHNVRHHVAALFEHAEHNRLAFRRVPAALATGQTTANESLVNLDNRTSAANRSVAVNRAHILADLVAHAPRGFVGHAKLPLDFLGRDTVTRSAELEHDEEPVAQRGTSAIKGRSSGRVNLMGAPLTLIGPTLHDAGVPRLATAARTRKVGAVANLKQVVETGFLGRKLVLKLAERGGFLRHTDCMPHSLTCRKGIIALHWKGFVVRDDCRVLQPDRRADRVQPRVSASALAERRAGGVLPRRDVGSGGLGGRSVGWGEQKR